MNTASAPTSSGVLDFPKPEAGPDPRLNLMTVDVEDYFHATGLAPGAPRSSWASRPGRVEYTTRRMLRLLADHDVFATFFVLGWVAERHPELVREIHAAGHEIASHGHEHRLVYEQTPEAFREDVHRAKSQLEDLTGTRVLGYRAPSFSITRKSTWALETLMEVGYRYDSSVFPVHRRRYGDPGSPRQVHWLREPHERSAGLLEVPPSTVRLFGRNLPVAGGGYFRAYPLAVTCRAIRHLNDVEGMPAVVYVHPWEIDPDQPRLHTTRANAFRHYLNLERTESRFVRLLQEFRFASVGQALASTFGVSAATPTARAASDFARAG